MLKTPLHLLLSVKGLGGDREKAHAENRGRFLLPVRAFSVVSSAFPSELLYCQLGSCGVHSGTGAAAGLEPGDIHEYAQAVTIGWCGCAGLRQHAERRASARSAVPARSGAALPVHAQRGVRHAAGSCGSAERGCV